MSGDTWMTVDAVRAFLTERTLRAIDPDTSAEVARVTYHSDGTCHAVITGGSDSPGIWGLTDDGYWTLYERFRGGDRHSFTLMEVDANSAQAYFADGRRAFLQIQVEPHSG